MSNLSMTGNTGSHANGDTQYISNTAPTNGTTTDDVVYNCVIIGSGPAGYSAGVYAGRALLNPILFEGTTEYDLWPGGQLTTTTEVENYLGHLHVNGFDLTDIFKQQAEKNGCKSISVTITEINTKSFPYSLTDHTGKQYRTRGIIVASGATAKRLFLPNEQRLWQHGISACAVCDGALPIFRNQPVAVVGGGDTAMEEATFLTKFASVVYIIHRRNEFRASKVMRDRVLTNKKVQVIYDSVVEDCYGDKNLEGINIKNIQTNETSKLPVKGLFYAIGHKPNVDFMKDSGVEFDEDGYIKTIPGSSKTSVKGLFAAGDVQDKRYRQAITAAGSGCMAALDLEHWLAEPESVVKHNNNTQQNGHTA